MIDPIFDKTLHNELNWECYKQALKTIAICIDVIQRRGGCAEGVELCLKGLVAFGTQLATTTEYLKNQHFIDTLLNTKEHDYNA